MRKSGTIPRTSWIRGVGKGNSSAELRQLPMVCDGVRENGPPVPAFLETTASASVLAVRHRENSDIPCPMS
jgi:hypothetical protein